MLVYSAILSHADSASDCGGQRHNGAMELIESTGALVRPDHALNVVKATH
jgi:hypothetical protein